MSISANCVWEMRATAQAGSVGGGGFVPGLGGTDYSQQDNPQYTFSDLASSNGTSTAPVVTSASHAFDATDVGNIMHITAGTSWTTGWYQIVSVSAGAATLDRACGSAATLAAGSYCVGGAINFGNATTDAAWGVQISAGQTIWMKAGTYATMLANVTLSAGAATTSLLNMYGYNTTRGDAPTGAARPLINTGAFLFITVIKMRLQNIQFTGTGASVLQAGSGCLATNLKVTNTSTTAARNAINMPSANAILYNCEAISYRGVGIRMAATPLTVTGCYVHDSNIGIQISTYGVVQSCIVESCVTSAIDLPGGNGTYAFLNGNTLYGSEFKTGIGVNVTSGTALYLMNNLIYGFSTGVTDASTGFTSFGDFNNFYNNTADVGGVWTKGANDKALNPSMSGVAQVRGTTATTSGTVLTDSSANFSNVVDGQDFVYIVSGTGITAGQYKITAHTATTLTLDIAPGTSATADKIYQVTTGRNFSVGLTMRATGFPALYPAGLSRAYPDIGAVQRYEYFSTDPGAANVLLGVSYTSSDAAQTGTLAVPLASETKFGVSVRSTTGTYDGSDRWTDPGVSNVKTGVAYKANSLTNNKTGVVDLPTVANVRLGVSYDNATKTGTVRVPTSDKVQVNYQYDAGDSVVGTLVSSGGGAPSYTVQDIVNGLLNEALSSHTTPGTVGAKLGEVAKETSVSTASAKIDTVGAAVSAVDTKVNTVQALLI